MENIRELLGHKYQHLLSTVKERVLKELDPLMEDLRNDMKKDKRKLTKQMIQDIIRNFMNSNEVQLIMHRVIIDTIKEHEAFLTGSSIN